MYTKKQMEEVDALLEVDPELREALELQLVRIKQRQLEGTAPESFIGIETIYDIFFASVDAGFKKMRAMRDYEKKEDTIH